MGDLEMMYIFCICFRGSLRMWYMHFVIWFRLVGVWVMSVFIGFNVNLFVYCIVGYGF
jgi:hypothetical protein